VRATLRYGLFRLAGGLPLDRTVEVILPANTAVVLASFARADWHEPKSEVAFAMLSDVEGRLLTRNRLILPLFREMNWAAPALQVRREGGLAVFSSPVFAWGVCVDLDGEQPLGDNFFDVWPGIPYVLPWSGDAAPHILHIGNLTT
jgi:beta-mannosidase